MKQPADDRQQASDEQTERERVDVQVEFGKHLRALRQAHDLTLERLAERADLHTNYVGSVERGERNLSLFNVWRLANGLGLTAADLMQTLPVRKPRRVGR